MVNDLRVCFLGDSFVAGVGDPEHLGWVGRLAARSHQAGRPLTAYNLGIRRQTSRDVHERWQAECRPRLPHGADCRVVVSYGVNDTTWEDRAPRVPMIESAGYLATLLRGAADLGWNAVVVGPVPVADPEQNQRTSALDDAFHAVCADAAVGYLSVLEQLQRSDAWMSEVRQGDGSHPAAHGYRALTDLIWPTWDSWITLPS